MDLTGLPRPERAESYRFGGLPNHAAGSSGTFRAVSHRVARRGPRPACRDPGRAALLAVFRLSDEFDRKREQLCRRDVAHIKDHELLEDNTPYGETFFVPPREYMSVALRLHSSSEFSPQPQQLLDEQAEGIDEAGSVVAGCTMALFWDIRAPSRSPDSEIRAAVPELILGPLLRHVGPTDATVWLESLAGIGAPTWTGV